MSGSFSLLLFLVVLILAVVVTLLKRKPAGDQGQWPFYEKPLMSKPELVLYARLVKALPEHRIFSQVALSRLLGVKRGFKAAEWMNRINRMSLDFVVCTVEGQCVAVIELDDRSHERADRKNADAKKDKALTDAGIRIIRWPGNSIPDHDGIRAEVLVKNEPIVAATSSSKRAVQTP